MVLSKGTEKANAQGKFRFEKVDFEKAGN